MSKEHVWSNWLRRLIPKAEKHMQHHRKKGQETPAPRSRQGGLHKLQVKKVCKSCNEGWMGTIVEKAKKYAHPLITDQPVTLDHKAQDILSAWIAISTIMGEYINLDTVVIKPVDLEALYKTHLPPDNWTICIGRYKGVKFFPVFRTHQYGELIRVLLPQPESLVATSRNNYQITTYTICSLLVQSFSCDNDIDFGIEASITPAGMIRIWPRVTDTIQWPCTDFLGDNFVTTIAKFSGGAGTPPG